MEDNNLCKQFNEFTTSSPRVFFASLDGKFDGLSDIIWKEYLEWQKFGVMKDFNFKDIIDDYTFKWRIGDEYFAQRIDKFAPFTKEQYKKGLTAVFSFMEDRPQYYKFRKMEGMFNPLRLLLYKFL